MDFGYCVIFHAKHGMVFQSQYCLRNFRKCNRAHSCTGCCGCSLFLLLIFAIAIAAFTIINYVLDILLEGNAHGVYIVHVKSSTVNRKCQGKRVIKIRFSFHSNSLCASVHYCARITQRCYSSCNLFEPIYFMQHTPCNCLPFNYVGRVSIHLPLFFSLYTLYFRCLRKSLTSKTK